MDKSIKKYIVLLLLGLIAGVFGINALAYIITGVNLDEIQTPVSLQIRSEFISDKQSIETLYDTIRSGSLRESKTMASVYWGSSYVIDAQYDGVSDPVINSIVDGQIYKYKVYENDVVVFEFYKNDSRKGKDYRVAYITSEGVYEAVKKLKNQEI